ncbi:hypothetical protein [Paracoccus marinaquae]|uniref:Uncharacterized protein n=1 Tax=Paracoccus marinaquae TaxID=2841926 RepID=A0ABS6AJQ3_9RHOB|nr:hypothetical protein [Paracoccus marinaquae]MBU3030825.1 hypothetical protein [Paracoccus marinaquae]
MRLILILLTALAVSIASLGAASVVVKAGGPTVTHQVSEGIQTGHPCCPEGEAGAAAHPCAVCAPVLTQRAAFIPAADPPRRPAPAPDGVGLMSRAAEVPSPPPRAG